MKNLLNISLFTIAAIHSNFIEANVRFSFEHHNKTSIPEKIDLYTIEGVADEINPLLPSIKRNNMIVGKVKLKECKSFNGLYCNQLQQYLQTLESGTSLEQLQLVLNTKFGMVHTAPCQRSASNQFNI